jgi:hypothetical protein
MSFSFAVSSAIASLRNIAARSGLSVMHLLLDLTQLSRCRRKAGCGTISGLAESESTG